MYYSFILKTGYKKNLNVKEIEHDFILAVHRRLWRKDGDTSTPTGEPESSVVDEDGDGSRFWCDDADANVWVPSPKQRINVCSMQMMDLSQAAEVSLDPETDCSMGILPVPQKMIPLPNA